GRTLGFPTANVQVSEAFKLIPADGVYAVRVQVRHQMYGGVMNIGLRPTVSGMGRTQEVHIFDFNEDIYGEKIVVVLVAYIRAEQKFEGLDALKAQIELDRMAAIQHLK
ncbi:MAG: riboflavin biosynthesis protein RibF, partial [Runella slithyformis]